MKHALAIALLFAPMGAAAQTTQGPVTVEIVAAGEVQVPAQRFRVSAKLKAAGKDNDAAGAALAAARAKVVAQLARLNVREAEPTESKGPLSIMSMFAGIGNQNKPSFSMDLTEEGEDGETKATATETVIFDAPNRAAVPGITTVVEANGGTVDDAAIAILDDYVAPTRLAKADALKKARTEADAYAATLGLRTTSVLKISERQDVVAGSLSFVDQLFGMFAPKQGTASDTVPIKATLMVEFQLAR